MTHIGHSFINFLTNHCLIEAVKMDSVDVIEAVEIHHVLRDQPIPIAEKEHRCYFKVFEKTPDGVAMFDSSMYWNPKLEELE